jgi:hypothetical protein
VNVVIILYRYPLIINWNHYITRLVYYKCCTYSNQTWIVWVTLELLFRITIAVVLEFVSFVMCSCSVYFHSICCKKGETEHHWHTLCCVVLTDTFLRNQIETLFLLLGCVVAYQQALNLYCIPVLPFLMKKAYSSPPPVVYINMFSVN